MRIILVNYFKTTEYIINVTAGHIIMSIMMQSDEIENSN